MNVTCILDALNHIPITESSFLLFRSILNSFPSSLVHRQGMNSAFRKVVNDVSSPTCIAWS